MERKRTSCIGTGTRNLQSKPTPSHNRNKSLNVFSEKQQTTSSSSLRKPRPGQVPIQPVMQFDEQNDELLKSYDAKSKQAIISDQINLIQQETIGLIDTLEDDRAPKETPNFRNERMEELLPNEVVQNTQPTPVKQITMKIEDLETSKKKERRPRSCRK